MAFVVMIATFDFMVQICTQRLIICRERHTYALFLPDLYFRLQICTKAVTQFNKILSELLNLYNSLHHIKVKEPYQPYF